MNSSRRKYNRLGARAVQIGFLVSVALAWYLATRVWRVNPLLLPDPVHVWEQLRNVIASGEYISDLKITLTEIFSAFGMAMIAGITVGYFISRSRHLTRVFEPLFAAIFSIPIILFLPLYVISFGLGESSKIAIGFTIAFFPIVQNTIAGFGNVDSVLVTAARSMGASNYQMFRYVLLPAALPVLLTGLRMGFAVGLLSIIASETIASFGGLGHRIVDLAASMDMARMFAYVVIVVAITAALNTAMSALAARGR